MRKDWSDAKFVHIETYASWFPETKRCTDWGTSWLV